MNSIVSQMNIDALYGKYFCILKQVFSEIQTYFPELKCSAELSISNSVNIISKIGNNIHIEPSDISKGCYNFTTNTIEIHPWCIDQFTKGNCDILYRVLIHEMIHARGETDETKTIEKAEDYFSKFSSKRQLL